MRALPLLALLLTATGCTAANTLALEPQTAPQGVALRTGTVPVLTPDPTGQTTQLTAAQKEATRRDLTASAARGRQAAGQVNAAQTRNDVARLRAEAVAERKRRLEQIEDRTINVAEQTIDPD